MVSSSASTARRRVKSEGWDLSSGDAVASDMNGTMAPKGYRRAKAGFVERGRRSFRGATKLLDVLAEFFNTRWIRSSRFRSTILRSFLNNSLEKAVSRLFIRQFREARLEKKLSYRVGQVSLRRSTSAKRECGFQAALFLHGPRKIWRSKLKTTPPSIPERRAQEQSLRSQARRAPLAERPRPC
jgi:hypothetical protein